MRSRSSKQSNRNLDLDRPHKVKQEPHLSGAYIRSLVKQLTSSRTKEPMDSKTPHGLDADGFPQNLSKIGDGFSETQQPQPPPKKQVRRRLHTSRPYQERLLNMAEARREIVTALKFHRAAMKQANEQQQPQQHEQPCPQGLGLHEKMSSGRIYPSNDSINTFSNYINNFSFTSLPSHCCWASPPVAPVPNIENFNLTLPNQTLGLNLNFHDFNNIETTLYHDNNPSIYTSSSSSVSSSSSSCPNLSCIQVPPIMDPSPPKDDVMDPNVMAGGLHHAMDDEEMAEIRSMGEQHDIEWNDTLNLVTSAWWFKFLKRTETSPQSNEEKGDEDGFNYFDEVMMDIPDWLNDGAVGNANEGFLLEQPFGDSHAEDYLLDAALPCLDIGEIEGMDGEWLT